MRLASTPDGRVHVVHDDLLVDVTGALGLGVGPQGGLRELLSRGGGHAAHEALAALDLDSLPARSLAGTALGAPVPHPGKVVGAPVNYLDHKVEMGEQRTIAEYGVFLKAPSSVSGPDRPVRLPYRDVPVHQEGELGVVVGTTAWQVPAERALEHVFGYVPLLDVTVRSTEDRSTRKSFPTFTPTGPWVTTADEVGDPGALGLRCWVGDELRQETSTSELVYGVAQLVAYASHVMPLEPGDLIATGTPAGVGPLHDGDRVVLEIDRLGRLEVTVSGAEAVAYADRPGSR
ncbi:fumarylacetoacetate hydrolase family protein [Cellulomonas sp. APG4]|uniref:fumarylacetoacetate hydrolase family protein n=1 Tax=Cellulomonas sp. APG4 TaxID=1538656 RepID=UPI00137A1FB8|nr:fumarylacetoacetate hydrolase family protein [Cellulomonas sp. APG4]NCT92620.1 fumarylacetoacetate hydrolase family protein [Cellulomonas sp. APG4]